MPDRPKTERCAKFLRWLLSMLGDVWPPKTQERTEDVRDLVNESLRRVEAYPRLVAALRELTVTWQHGSGEAIIKDTTYVSGDALVRAGALLAELGETEE